jgi:hypothetical protein
MPMDYGLVWSTRRATRTKGVVVTSDLRYYGVQFTTEAYELEEAKPSEYGTLEVGQRVLEGRYLMTHMTHVLIRL